jgi:hypothetical protein
MNDDSELLKLVKELMQGFRTDIAELQIKVAEMQGNKDNSGLLKIIAALLAMLGALIGIKEVGK